MEALSKELSTLVGVQVELAQPKAGTWVAVPKDRALLQTRLWRALRGGPQGGVAASSAGAALLLARAAGASGLRAVTKTQQATSWVKQTIEGQTLRAADVKAMAEAEGLSWSVVDRAARSLCVQRSKHGIEGPCYWTM